MIIQVNESLLNTLGDAPDVPRVLVGTMKDLNEKRQVSYEVSLSLFKKIYITNCCFAFS